MSDKLEYLKHLEMNVCAIQVIALITTDTVHILITEYNYMQILCQAFNSP